MVFCYCVHATARLHATDAAISGVQANHAGAKKIRSCDICYA